MHFFWYYVIYLLHAQNRICKSTNLNLADFKKAYFIHVLYKLVRRAFVSFNNKALLNALLLTETKARREMRRLYSSLFEYSCLLGLWALSMSSVGTTFIRKAAEPKPSNKGTHSTRNETSNKHNGISCVENGIFNFVKNLVKFYKDECTFPDLFKIQGGSNMIGTDFFVTIIAHHSSNSQTGLNRF